MTTAIYILGSFCLLATLAPLIPSNKWWIRGFDFPHAQISFLTLVTLGLILIHGTFSFVLLVVSIVIMICFVHQFIIILPYTPLSKVQVKKSKNQGTTVSLLSCNVYMENRKYGKVLSLIAQFNPDIVLLVETNQVWLEQTSGLKEQYPYAVSCPLENTYGMILYSKLPLIEPTIEFLVEKDIPSIHTLVRASDDLTFRLHCLHPAPPSPTENESALQRDAELLIVAKKIDSATIPTVVMGDLNDVAWSKTSRLFQKVSGLLDPRRGRGFYNTFHADYPFLRWPLDHVFHSVDFNLLKLKRAGHVGSDHFPIYIKLSYHPKAHKHQDEPQANGEEIQLANEKIDEALG